MNSISVSSGLQSWRCEQRVISKRFWMKLSNVFVLKALVLCMGTLSSGLAEDLEFDGWLLWYLPQWRYYQRPFFVFITCILSCIWLSSFYNVDDYIYTIVVSRWHGSDCVSAHIIGLSFLFIEMKELCESRAKLETSSHFQIYPGGGKSDRPPPIWNCQSTEWTLCFSMSPMRAHLKQSTNKKI